MKIFENISKEKFIEEINKNRCGSLETCFLFYVDFNYIKYKTKKLALQNNNEFEFDFYRGKVYKSIIDITNYEEELELFNSFERIRKYDGKYITIVDNYNNYLNHKNSNKNRFSPYFYDVTITRSKPLRPKSGYEIKNRYSSDNFYFKLLNSFDFNFIKDIETFDKYVSLQEANKLKQENKEKLKNISKEAGKILSVKKAELSNKILSVVEDSFRDFNDFDNNGRLRYSLSFSKYDSFNKANKFTEKHIIKNNFFNEFTLKINGYSYGTYSKKFNGIKVENYMDRLKLHTDCIQVVAEYFECEVYMANIIEFHFYKKK